MIRSSEKITESINVAEAKKRLSDLLGRVAYGGETVLITRRGRPMAKLVPPDEQTGEQGLSGIKGWLDDDDPFFLTINSIVEGRSKHRPRALQPPKRRRR